MITHVDTLGTQHAGVVAVVAPDAVVTIDERSDTLRWHDLVISLTEIAPDEAARIRATAKSGLMEPQPEGSDIPVAVLLARQAINTRGLITGDAPQRRNTQPVTGEVLIPQADSPATKGDTAAKAGDKAPDAKGPNAAEAFEKAAELMGWDAKRLAEFRRLNEKVRKDNKLETDEKTAYEGMVDELMAKLAELRGTAQQERNKAIAAMKEKAAELGWDQWYISEYERLYDKVADGTASWNEHREFWVLDGYLRSGTRNTEINAQQWTIRGLACLVAFLVVCGITGAVAARRK